MGLYLQVDERDATPLASIRGWADVRAWTNGLDEEAHGEVLHLVEHGWSDEVARLREQLAAAARAHPPRGSVAETVASLLDKLMRSEGAEVVSVTDGLGVDK